MRRVVLVAAVTAFVVVLSLGVAQTGRRLGDLGHRREEALAVQSEPVDVAADIADAFRRFLTMLHAGDRFALVFGDAVDRDRMGTYRLVALSYLYPAVATSDPSDADFVMVFDQPSPSIVSAFEHVDTVDGVWLGRRRT